MYILILYLPLLSFLICSLLGRKIGYVGSKIISNLLLILSCFIASIIFNEIVTKEININIKMFSWFNLGFLSNDFGFLFDMITSSMLILITFVSFFVHLFSTSYMSDDPHLPRFMSYLSLFTFFMIVLVTSNNLVQLFIGWEGVGLCSYLLINFWYTRIQANKAAIKAMIINKVGDIGLLLAIIFLWKNSGLIFYNNLFPLYSIIPLEKFLNWINIFLLIGVIGKSAQIGLHMWLPDAMEGPTPVSALIHAATMVTAGVFLIIRISPLFDNTPLILLIIVFIGSLTAFFSASIGLTQSDLKKIIAYSTCSQLGYMVMICGFSYYNTSLFHLLNHGFFKALLFLSAGSIIHSINNEQDLRKMGNLKIFLPFSYICVVIGSMSLMGLPFLTGFYSKDLLLELIYQKHYLSFSLWLGLGAAFITAFYSFRLIYFSFFSTPQYNKRIIKLLHEGNWNLITPLFILLLCSIIIGFNLQNFIMVDIFPIMILNINKFFPLILSLLGSFLSIILGYFIIKWWFINLNFVLNKIYNFITKTWYFDYIINFYLVKPILTYGFTYTYKIIDNQLLEIIGPFSLTKEISKYSSFLSKYHLGKITSYSFAFTFFILFFIFKF
uniref:NADH dehydrogenase subunit 5 n=1 Tax=Stephanomia amphytridis TaxID=645353 RepID=UPI0026E461C4|nr:NADH dehydrogenase subunit 5 [Stephanomia amphytridis]WJJ70201.1 NADH dehydrogenase subunit 5 [Stephanomia amphytridis]